MLDLLSLTWSHLQEAKAAPNGRSAGRIVHDGDLRQTVVALAAGTELGEHNAPHAATLQVLHGRVRVTSPSGDEDLGTGTLHLLTHERHAVLALEDAVFLLTTVTGTPTSSTPTSSQDVDRAERTR
jgi:quercetin dioxygenase-like cupin family protein